MEDRQVQGVGSVRAIGTVVVLAAAVALAAASSDDKSSGSSSSGTQADPEPPREERPEAQRASKIVRPADLPPARAEFVRTVNGLLTETDLEITVYGAGDGDTIRYDSPVCGTEKGFNFLVERTGKNAKNVGFKRAECSMGGRLTYSGAL